MSVNNKKEIRAEMLKIRSAVTDKHEKSIRIIQNIITSDEYKKCTNLFVYLAVNDEPETEELIREAVFAGKKVFLPKCENSEGYMTFRNVTSLSELKKGFFSIPEPPESAPECDSTGECDLCIVPGTAFDLYGNRIGYGKGYYDRFLSGFRGFSMGVCFSACLTQKIPTDVDDVSLNAVCDENRIYYIGRL